MAQSFIIFAGPQQWTIGISADGQTQFIDAAIQSDPSSSDGSTPAQPPSSAEASSPAALADAALRILREHGYEGGGLTLAIPSDWCMCALIDIADLPRREAQQAMLYRLEEQLPLPAEELVADFVIHDVSAFGVAVQIATVAPIVDALESVGIPVEAIVPATILAAQNWIAREEIAAAGALLVSIADKLEFIVFDKGRPLAWHIFCNEPADAALHLRVAGVGRAEPLRVIAAPLDEPVREALAQVAEITLAETDLPPAQQSAAAFAQTMTEGGAEPWVNLRREKLAPAEPYRQFAIPLKCAAAAAALLLIGASLSLLWRGFQYDRLADNYDNEQMAIVSEVLPGRTLRAGQTPSVVLKREAESARAMAGESSEAPVRPSALTTLFEVLSRLPSDIRYQLSLMRLGDEGVLLEGEARSRTDVDGLAAALRSGGMFRIDSPPTEMTPEGFASFTISGTPAKPPKPVKVAP